MANILSKHTQRQGDLSDLPVGPDNGLLAGEFGYATDEYRLFIGNEQYSQDSNGTVNYRMPVDLDSMYAGSWEVYFESDGVAPIKASNYTYRDFVLTFNDAPTSERVVLYFNTEIMTAQAPEGISDPVRAVGIAGPATEQAFPYITIDSNRFDDILIRYTLNDVLTSNKRQGTLRISIDRVGETFSIEDTYNSNCTGTALDHVFDGTLNGTTFILNYTTTDTDESLFSWIEDNFKSDGSATANNNPLVSGFVVPSGDAPVVTPTTISSSSNLSDLADVSVTVPSTGQALVWDGAAWSPDTVGGGAAYDQSLNTTDDVEFNSLTVSDLTITGAGTTVIESGSNIVLDAPNRVSTNAPFRMVNLTTIERDAIIAINGDTIYNTDTNKFQGYANGAWVDLH